MNKKHIIEEIKKTAKNNNGLPLGIDKFKEATGIRKEDWYGKYWTKWTDAQKEAGFTPNQFSKPRIDDEILIKKFISYIKELGHFPTKPEMKIKHYNDSSFPAENTFKNRFGRKHKLAQKVIEYCERKKNMQNIIELCINHAKTPTEKNTEKITEQQCGHVYLLKHDNTYKIGKSYDASRRYKEIRVQMPHDTEEIHVIETDDPSGIEAYWHNRFKDKRLKGEWFKLSRDDVKAFKKRKFM